MAYHSRARTPGVAALLFVCTLFACDWGGDGETHDDNNFRADVIECEDALARLLTCCPNFDATPVLCRHNFDQTSGCGSASTTAVDPAFSIDESACIRATSCDALVSSGVCMRAQAAREYVHSTVTSTPPSAPTSSSSGSNVPSSSSEPVTTTTNQTHPPVCP